MTTKEEKRRKRAILYQLLNQEVDWMDNTDTVEQIQEFVSTEFDSYGRTPEEQLSKSDITEETFLECIMNDYEYVAIQKLFKLTRNALNLWRKQKGFYGQTKKQLKEQYRSKFLSQ